MEAAELGLFMISACSFGVLLFHPDGFGQTQVRNPLAVRALMGMAMALTALAIIHSPLGKRSGGHLNPAVTLTFLRLGKVQPWDAVFYVAAQFAGGIAGVLVAAALLGRRIAAASVNYVVTVPGSHGWIAAFLAEAGISFVLMSTILLVSNTRNLARYTPLFAAFLVMTYIARESPISGMSMNPARTFGSALPARVWTSLWIYFVAPVAGMLLAAEVYLRLRGAQRVFCAKLHHHNDKRCIFRCRFGEMVR
jgi:aquaporin Z